MTAMTAMKAMTVHTTLTVDGDRLNNTIDWLAEIGKLPNGDVCRLAFTTEDSQARNLVQQWMLAAGMTVRTDAAGNLIGTYLGQQPEAPALATGSHIDTVPSGGRYDGTLGVLAGIEVVRVLQENHLQLNHSIEVIVFSDEESSMVGSRGMGGAVNLKEAASTATGVGAVGGNWEQLKLAQRDRSHIAAFVELHIEQGGVLEERGKEIGVVTGVVGMSRYAVTVIGCSNHAGTTPMSLRKDALIAAAQVVLAVEALALQQPSQPVATVGSFMVAPNAANIIPGQVDLTVDMRDLSQACLDEMLAQLKQQLAAIATATRTEISISPILQVKPTIAATPVQAAIAQICNQLEVSYCHLPSRAGHDAMEIGRFTDMGMIFVPSQGGVSHSREEYTTPEQCTLGANVLLHTLLQLDQLYP
jgi:beta-ureidopropionase / N-carbamoyl-L-amino-acid hydrolase